MYAIVRQCIFLLLAISFFSCNKLNEASDNLSNTLYSIHLYALTEDGSPHHSSITDFLQNNQIGIFSFTGDSLNSSLLAFNKLHGIDKQACISPYGNDEECKIDISTTTHFMAYSPFVELSDAYYPIDLRNLHDDKHRFLYARTTVEDCVDNQQIILTFQCQLSHLKMILLDKDGVGIGTNNAEVTIKRPMCASFDLTNGLLMVDYTLIDELPLMVIRSQINTTVLPGKGGEIRVSYQGDIYRIDLSDVEFIGGKEYQYTLQLLSTTSSGQGDGNITVEDWTNIDGGTLYPTPL